MKKLKTGHYLIAAFAVLIGLLIAMNFLNNNQEKYLIENGKDAIAVVTNIDVNNYKANELEGKFIENYVFTFQFSVDGEEVKSVRTIEKKAFKKYFDKAVVVNDQINILYDPSNPKNNTIKELDQK
jgi:hypothetical protein